MTEPEVWKALEANYRQQNWTGVAVLADWFEEQQQASLADTLRWLSRREAADRSVIFLHSSGVYWLVNGVHRRSLVHAYGSRYFSQAIESVHKERTEALEDLL